MNILNLTNLKVLEVKEDSDNYRIISEMQANPDKCINCFSFSIVGFGKKKQLYMDLPMHGKRVGIELTRKRYKCNSCLKTFLEILPDMDDKRLATKRLIKYVEKHSLEKTFVSIAEEIGIDEKTIRNIFKDHIEKLNKNTQFATPSWLGIDEIHILKKPRCVISNLEHKTVIEILPKRDKETVKNYLSKLPDKQTIKYVSMDMWQPYKDAINICFPKAKIVIDKFHVVRMANQALESIRKATRASLTDKQRRTLMHDRFILLKRAKDVKIDELLILESWIRNLPDLGKAYELKEAFFDIWNLNNRQEAIYAYENWKKEITPELELHFQALLTAVKNWHEEIFNYFNQRITNAFTESLNGLIRVINRIGRGYSFDALRAKILFTKGCHKVEVSKYPKVKLPPGVLGCLTAETVNYGVDVFELLKVLDSPEEYIL